MLWITEANKQMIKSIANKKLIKVIRTDSE